MKRSPVGTNQPECSGSLGSCSKRTIGAIGHDVALHALDLGDLGHAAHAVGALGVDDEVDGLADVLKDLTRGHAGVGLLDERAKAYGHLAAVVRMDSGERAVVAGGHGLEHVEGRRIAALADDDAVGGAGAARWSRGRGR